MHDDRFFMTIESTPVPKIFWSDLTDRPFENCVMCEKYLLEDGVQYLIEKALKSYKESTVTSTVFEYAMCLSCAEKMQQTLSVDSKKKIDAYYAENVDFEERKNQLRGNLNVEDWLKECIIHKKEVSDGGEFQIYGQCDGKEFLFYDFPFMIRGEAVEEMVGLLSDETLDELNDFMNTLTSGPPEFQELLKTGGVKLFV